MAAATPRRSSRIPHQDTPRMSERKKALFQSHSEAFRESLTKHRQLTVVESDSDNDECDLGIMGPLDSSSCDENDASIPKTPEKTVWRTTRSRSQINPKETYDLKNFIKSPFTLKKYQTRYSCPEKCTGSLSTPVTPHLQHHPTTPSSTHSCASIHTTSSTSSRARKSLASLIADTESCSSSLKDLNFDTDSSIDSKENTPSKSVCRSTKSHKMTPKLQSFKGILVEQRKNESPLNQKVPVVCLTKMNMGSIMSPTQMLKTPHNSTPDVDSPPKLGHRRSAVLIDESPESTCDSDKSHKRLHFDSKSDNGPNSKHPKLDINQAPKARLSLFNSDRLKEILSAKSFYGKTNPELNKNVAVKISHAIEATQTHRRRLFPQSHSQRRKRQPGQINLGVRHRIRKPKINKNKIVIFKNVPYASLNESNGSKLNTSTVSKGSHNSTMISNNNTSILSQNISQEHDKADPFDKEHQTIEALLSQWEEEAIPTNEPTFTPRPLPCFSSTIIEETNTIFQPITAVPVNTQEVPTNTEAVIFELGTKASMPQNAMTNLPDAVADQQNESPVNEIVNVPLQEDVVMSEFRNIHGEVPKEGQFLPVEGGYIFVGEAVNNAVSEPLQEVLPDLDEIERELRMLDEQILQMAQSNNIDPGAVLPPQCGPETPISLPKTGGKEDKSKLFPIFSNPNPGQATPSSKVGVTDKSKKILKTGNDQYVIDAGQKKFGATQCNECGVIYQIGDPQDEHDHLVHHTAKDVLRFNGFKEECIVGRASEARCIRIRGSEPGWRRVQALLERVVHPHLGYAAKLPRPVHEYTAYLYIEKKQIVGCLVVEPKTRAFKLIPGDPDCCSIEDYPVKCGVSRVWTHINYRRRGVASRLLDCARASFLYGSALTANDLAFSAPTASGKLLGTKYCDTENFYLYLD